MIVGTARQAADQLEPIFARVAGEMLAVLHVDADRRTIAILEFPGTSDETLLLPVREIIASALALGSAGLVIAHNHPSGDPKPSRADIEATRRLADSAAALDISLYDHLIFAGGHCRSFRELGLL